ncbi:hypothetical protein BDF19DRAFT_18203 [Syncephalis fuscata]|nr:hypothetical protein BDF19DRAFT_18203 [Syncephalis fuscata]
MREIACLVISLIYALFALSTTLLFYYYRDDTGIRHRSVRLTVFSGIINIPLTIILLSWTPMNSNMPGWVIIWVLSLLVPLWVLLFLVALFGWFFSTVLVKQSFLHQSRIKVQKDLLLAIHQMDDVPYRLFNRWPVLLAKKCTKLILFIQRHIGCFGYRTRIDARTAATAQLVSPKS